MNQPNQTNQTNDLKGKKGFKRIVNAMFYSRDGLQAAFVHEAAFRQLVFIHTSLLIILCFCDFEWVVKMLLLAVSFASLVIELLNTGLEAIVDDISLEKRPLAKRAKDVGSAAQMLTLILLGILWLMAFCA